MFPYYCEFREKAGLFGAVWVIYGAIVRVFRVIMFLERCTPGDLQDVSPIQFQFLGLDIWPFCVRILHFNEHDFRFAIYECNPFTVTFIKIIKNIYDRSLHSHIPKRKLCWLKCINQ